MARTMRREAWPLTVRLKGGRVLHMARALATSDRLKTACGQIGHPAPPWPVSAPVTCVRCINQPWSQDQRTHPGKD
jgi:hypothetical protein